MGDFPEKWHWSEDKTPIKIENTKYSLPEMVNVQNHSIPYMVAMRHNNVQ